MRGRILTIVKRLLVGIVLAQLTAIAGLVGADLLRKRRRPYDGRFPRTAPLTASVGGTEITTFAYGGELYDSMLQDIRGARKRILFETYIIKDDPVGQEFKTALVEAAERGVDVYVIYDGFANLVVPPRFLRFPPPVHVLRYPVLQFGSPFLLRRTGRNHRKILVVDDEVGYVGGYNIGSDYAMYWRDTHLRLHGPTVWELENAFIDFWNTHRTEGLPELSHSGPAPWNTRLRAYRNVPYQLMYPIRGMYMEAIDRATHHVRLTQAYFIPDREFVEVLLAAAGRGVQVEILVPANSNHVLPDWLSRGHYSTLLRGGVRLWLYQDAMVHAKTATIDGLWSTVGTANIDRLSLIGNYEINMEVFDRTVAAHLEEAFANDLANAHLLTLEEWESRPVWAKLTEGLLAPLRPLL